MALSVHPSLLLQELYNRPIDLHKIILGNFTNSYLATSILIMCKDTLKILAFVDASDIVKSYQWKTENLSAGTEPELSHCVHTPDCYIKS